MKLPSPRFGALALALLALLSLFTLSACGPVPQPKVDIAQPGACIAPVEEMRRQHPEMLQHQRDLTVHAGIRGAKASLNGCIDCHAGTAGATRTAVNASGGFCDSCHAYAGVKLDCFECHAGTPGPGGSPHGTKQAAAPSPRSVQ